MNLDDLIDDLELHATLSAQAGGADPESARLHMASATALRKVRHLIAPFAEAANRADKTSEEQKRMLGSELSSEASPGWGIKRKHLDAAREFLRETDTPLPKKM